MILRVLSEWPEKENKSTVSHIEKIYHLSLSLARHVSLPVSLRQEALEFLVGMCERFPTAFRKNYYASKVFEAVFGVLSDLTVDINDLDSASLEFQQLTEEALDRLAITFGGKQIVPCALSLFQEACKEKNPHRRAAGIDMVGLICEGAKVELLPHVPLLLSSLYVYARDEYAVVRWMVVNAATQMLHDFGSEIGERHPEKLVYIVLGGLKDEEVRVRRHAAAALAILGEICPINNLSTYLGDILQQLSLMLESDTEVVVIEVLNALSAISNSCNEDFGGSYSMFMPLLLRWLDPTRNDLSNISAMQSKALECATNFLLSCLEEKRGEVERDAHLILSNLSKLELLPTSNHVDQVLETWARLFKALGSEFMPEMKNIIPLFLNCASASPTLRVLAEEEQLDNNWQVVHLRQRQVCIQTSVVEGKKMALEMLQLIVTSMGVSYEPFLEESFRIAMDAVQFLYEEGVQVKALNLCSVLFQCLHQIEQPRSQKLLDVWHKLFLVMTSGLNEHACLEHLSHKCVALNMVLPFSPELSDQQVQKIFSFFSALMLHLMTLSSERKMSRAEAMDEEELNDVLADEKRDFKIVLDAAQMVSAAITTHPMAAHKHSLLLQPLLEDMNASSWEEMRKTAVHISEQFEATKEIPF